MSLLSLLIVLAVVGFVLWLITQYIPMNETVKRIIVAVTVLILCVWLLQTFGVLGRMEQVRIH